MYVLRTVVCTCSPVHHCTGARRQARQGKAPRHLFPPRRLLHFPLSPARLLEPVISLASPSFASRRPLLLLSWSLVRVASHKLRTCVVGRPSTTILPHPIALGACFFCLACLNVSQSLHACWLHCDAPKTPFRHPASREARRPVPANTADSLSCSPVDFAASTSIPI